MGKQRSFRTKAAHFVSDLTTVLLNPISDKSPRAPPPPLEDEVEPEGSQAESVPEEGSEGSLDGPDTSSFTAFLYSLLASDSKDESNIEGTPEIENLGRESEGKRGFFSRGKQSLGKALSYAGRFGGYRSQALEKKGKTESKIDDEIENRAAGEELRSMERTEDALLLVDLPEMSDPSHLLSEKTRGALYVSLPSLVKGRKWILLYSTWKHGISLSTLYRRSQLCPGLSLLVVGDCRGAVFGGLVEVPLRPSKSRKYQGTNSTFIFTDLPGNPVIFRPTGANRYYTLCSTDFLALGGGDHFALYLDGDLLNGSSSASETYGNSCLSHSQDFEVRQVELWGFVYASKYEEMLALSQTEAPGICRW